MTDAERFLHHVLAPRREDEAWRLEFVDGDTKENTGHYRAWVDLAKMATCALKFGAVQNVYFAVSTFKRPGRRTLEDSRQLQALWADMDCGPGKAYATPEDAQNALAGFPLQPTAMLASGRGVHAYWKLRAPVEGEERDHAVHLVRGLAQMLQGDPNVADAARIMRIPGTKNLDPGHKKDGKTYEVTLLALNDLHAGYDLADFVAAGVPAIKAQREEARAAAEAAGIDAPDDLEYAGGQVNSAPRLGGIMLNLLNTPGDGGYPSNSEADAAVVMAMVSPTGAGLSPADTYATFMASPRGQDVIARGKPDPQGYVMRTIRSAVAHIQAARPEDVIRRQIMSKVELQETDRSALLADVSARLSIRVVGFYRIVADTPEFRMQTDQGQVILGTWENVHSITKFEQHVEPITMAVLPPLKKREWAQIRATLLKCAIDVQPSPEMTEAGRIKSWLDQYLEANPPPVNEGEAEQFQCAVQGLPFVDQRRVHVRLPDLLRWVKFNLEARPTQNQVINALHAVGWEFRFIKLKSPDKKHRSFRAWAAPAGWQLGQGVDAAQ